jgi:hypothetical protein
MNFFWVKIKEIISFWVILLYLYEPFLVGQVIFWLDNHGQSHPQPPAIGNLMLGYFRSLPHRPLSFSRPTRIRLRCSQSFKYCIDKLEFPSSFQALLSSCLLIQKKSSSFSKSRGRKNKLISWWEILNITLKGQCCRD